MLEYAKRETAPRRALFATLICATMVLASLAARASGECSDDFFSYKTCRSFDDTTWRQGQSLTLSESGTTDGDTFSLSGTDFLDGQIWSRTPGSGNRGTMGALGDQVVGARPIHDFQCSTDFFGNVSCDGISQLLLDSGGQISNKALQDKK